MYQVKCDDYPLLDLRDDDLILITPKITVEVNTVGSGSFTIYNNHPYYDKLQKLKSVFEVSDDFGVLFRGRMTDDTIDFNKGKAVDLEGAMAFFNDSIVRPYAFPDDFINDEEYIAAAESGNVIEFYLKWLITQHNEQVEEFQRFKLGVVTVTDPNNYLSRSDSNYPNTWNVLKSKLFDSALGGYLCIRYEDDGNYIDYLSDFTLTNTQPIEFGENLLDLKSESDASATYTAIIPFGAEVETTDEDGNIVKSKVTIDIFEDGEQADNTDIVKKGDSLYSKSGVESYGWIYAPISETTWSDVTAVLNLMKKAKEYLSSNAVMLSNTMTISAVDLHYSDRDIQSFRIYRNVMVISKPHGHDAAYRLTKLSIDLLNPQNTKITVGESKRTLTDINSSQQSSALEKVESAQSQIEQNKSETTEIMNQLLSESTTIINTCNEIILSALESYVETATYTEFRETVEAQFRILSDEISIAFTAATEQIENVNGDLQLTKEQIEKHFTFTENGLNITAGENAMGLVIDNDIVSFTKNGEQFGWWDGVDFHTGNIYIDVNERAQFGNFAFVPRSDGSLSFLKVGG